MGASCEASAAEAASSELRWCWVLPKRKSKLGSSSSSSLGASRAASVGAASGAAPSCGWSATRSWPAGAGVSTISASSTGTWSVGACSVGAGVACSGPACVSRPKTEGIAQPVPPDWSPVAPGSAGASGAAEAAGAAAAGASSASAGSSASASVVVSGAISGSDSIAAGSAAVSGSPVPRTTSATSPSRSSSAHGPRAGALTVCVLPSVRVTATEAAPRTRTRPEVSSTRAKSGVRRIPPVLSSSVTTSVGSSPSAPARAASSRAARESSPFASRWIPSRAISIQPSRLSILVCMVTPCRSAVPGARCPRPMPAGWSPTGPHPWRRRG